MAVRVLSFLGAGALFFLLSGDTTQRRWAWGGAGAWWLF